MPDIGIKDPDASEGIEDNARVQAFHVFYGDDSLDYALERINEKAKSGSLEAVVRKLREGFYQ